MNLYIYRTVDGYHVSAWLLFPHDLIMGKPAVLVGLTAANTPLELAQSIASMGTLAFM